jgi:hypothetical protein
MKRGLKKSISLGVVLLMLFIITVPAFAQFSDTNGNWAAAEISKWVEKGIINGNPNGTYAPEKAISRAEFSSMLCKLFNYVDLSSTKFTDVSENSWYSKIVSKTASAGVIVGDKGKFRPTESISRQEAAVMLSRAFMLSANASTADKYTDAKDIAAWAKAAVSAVTEKGYMSGRPGNLFAPKENVTRAEAVKIIDNTVQELKNLAGVYTGTIEKNLMVNTKDVTLKNMVINGDLFLAPGIGDGNVTLDNVKVKGKTIVMGGGENSIDLVNTSLTGTLIVIKVDGKIRIVAEGSSEVNSVLLNSGARLEENGLTGLGFGNVTIMRIAPGQSINLDGDFDEVSINAPNTAVQISDGHIGTLVVGAGATNAGINLGSGASITTLTANAGVQVTGQGSITTANINAAGVVIVMKPTNTVIAAGITAIVSGTSLTSNTTTTTTTTTTNNNNNNNNNTDTSITSIALTTKSGGAINATVSGTTYTVDLSGVSDAVYINGLKVTSPLAATKLVISDATNPVTGSNGTFDFGGNNSIIEAFFGAGFVFDGDVSVKTIKSILSGSITRNVSVYSGTTKLKDITLTIKVSAGDTLGTQSLLNCYSVSAASGTITATLKSGKESQSVLTGGQFYQLLVDMITVPAGYVYSGVAVGTSGDSYSSYTKDNLVILQNLASQVGKGINAVTLLDLKTKHTTVKVKASSPNNADHIITVIFG